MESPAYLENRTCKACGRFDILCDCVECPTCSHRHLRPNGAYMKCPVCVFDPPERQGCWITVPG